MTDVRTFTVEGERPRVGVARRRRTEHVRRRSTGALLAGLGLVAAAALAGRATSGLGRRRRAGDLVGGIVGELGRGFLAGMAGTLAITTASTTQQLVTDAIHARKAGQPMPFALRDAIVKPWQFSSGVAGKLLGFTPIDADHERRLAVMAHWEYGSTWGLSLPLLGAFGVRGIAAMGAVLAGQLGAEMLVMPALGLFPPPTQWGRDAIASSVYQHALYAVAAVSAFEWLKPRY